MVFSFLHPQDGFVFATDDIRISQRVLKSSDVGRDLPLKTNNQ
ncbi:hypothetical protein D515_04684 [Grimontia indica]|uniref:Uncharacterized protein n=1 Tax=Grimontia indica TaxID=1056512 RepID=R1IP07_9GAMM|nr:hypothetical protein D515_04684 [Grimontia indica]